MFEISYIKYAIPNKWLKVLKSDISIKSKVNNKLKLLVCITAAEKKDNMFTSNGNKKDIHILL